MRRYFIHKYRSVTWSLVFDEGLGKWHVEKKGPTAQCVRLLIEEFERTDNGKQLRDALSSALHAAEIDA